MSHFLGKILKNLRKDDEKIVFKNYKSFQSFLRERDLNSNIVILGMPGTGKPYSCIIPEPSEIRRIVEQLFVVHIGGNVSQIYIKGEKLEESGNQCDFLILISEQENKALIPHYESVLRNCVEEYKLREKHYANDLKLSLEQMLKYCIIVNDIKVAGFTKLDSLVIV